MPAAGQKPAYGRLCRCVGRSGEARMNDDEVAKFIFDRMAELVVVLSNEHVGTDKNAAKGRTDTRIILVELANWAARHGRADLTVTLSALAAKITESEARQRSSFGPPGVQVP